MRWRHAAAACVGALVLGGISGPALAASPTSPASRPVVSRSMVTQAENAAQQATVATATRLTASRRSSAYDTVVAFTAKVTARSGSPAGLVLFADATDGSYLAAEPLRSGVATLSTAALAPGARRIVAEYLGSKTFAVSKSGQLAVTVAAAGADAVAYQTDAGHDGYQARGGPSTRGLTRKWTRTLASTPVSDDAEAGDVSYPVIAGGRVFATVESSVGYGTELFALSAATGRTDWSTGLGGTYGFSALTYDGQRVFALNYDGVLTAYTASNGHEDWAVQLPGQYSFTAPPTAYDGMVYAGGSGDDGTLYAVSEATGQVIWNVLLPVGADKSAPAVNASGLYVSYDCQQDFRFHLDGLLAWHPAEACYGGGGSTAVLHGASVYARGAYNTPLILNQSNGRDTGSFATSTAPAFAGSTMFTLQQGRVVAMAASGSPDRWSFGAGGLVTAPVVSDGVVFAGSSKGTVYGISASTGRQVWSGKAGSVILGPDEQDADILVGMAVGGGLLVVPAGNQISAFG
jgi:outer membrane protein assembly factor BamB